jgi:hypothetical protein
VPIWQKFVSRVKNELRKVPAIQALMPWEGVGRFRSELSDVRSRIGDTRLEQLFLAYEGPRLNKWLHYLPVYDRHLSQYRRAGSFSILEIGVFGGGSLKLWREYFGPAARIFGIDINPECAQHDGNHGQVRIGSQADPDFLRRVVEEMGGIDVVIDDGSHVMEHINITFQTLFPLLRKGGTYIVEDLHTAYWPSFGGGYHAPQTFIETAKSLLDDMHHWYHRYGVSQPMAKDSIHALHFYDSMVVLEKSEVLRPTHVIVGSQTL